MHILISSTALFCLQYYMQTKHGLIQRKKERTETDYDMEGNEKIHAGNIVAWAHLKWDNFGVEQIKKDNYIVPKVEVLQG